MFIVVNCRSLMTDVFLDWLWTVSCISMPRKQESPWNFWSILKILGAHRDVWRKTKQAKARFNVVTPAFVESLIFADSSFSWCGNFSCLKKHQKFEKQVLAFAHCLEDQIAHKSTCIISLAPKKAVIEVIKNWAKEALIWQKSSQTGMQTNACIIIIRAAGTGGPGGHWPPQSFRKSMFIRVLAPPKFSRSISSGPLKDF